MAGDLNFKFRAGMDNSEALAKFRQLKDELTSLRDSIKNAASEVKIKVSVDSASLAQDVQQIRTNLKNQLGELSVEVVVKADSASIAASATTIRNQLKTAIGTVTVDLNVDAASVTSQAATIRTSINTALGNAISIRLGVDLPHLQAQLTNARTIVNNFFNTSLGAIRLTFAVTQADLLAARAQIATLTNSGAKLKLGIDLAYLNSQIAHARTMLASLTTGGMHINIDATATSLIAALNSLKASVDQLHAAMGAGGGGNGGNGGNGGGGGNGGRAGGGIGLAILGGVKGKVLELAASLVSLENVAALAKMADEATLLNVRLSQLIGTQAEVEHIQERLYQSAQRIGVSYQSMTEATAQMLPAMQQQGKGAEEAVKLTEILQVTAQLSGASTAEAANSANQFGQAIGSGTLQAEQLNTVLNGNHVLAKTLAESLKLPESSIDVTIGMLKKLAADGRISNEVLTDALLGSYDKVMNKADEIPQTFDKVWQKTKNLTLKFVEDLNKQGFFSGAISGLNDLYLKIQELEQNGTLSEWANGIKGVLEAVGGVMSDLFGIATDVFGEIGTLWSDLTGGIEEGTGVQITLFDLLKAAVNGVGLVFVMLRAAIQIAIGLVKYLVREAVLDMIDQFNAFHTNLEILKTNAGFFLDVLGNHFVTFAQIASSALDFNWTGIKAAWHKGFNNLEELAKERTKRIAKIKENAQANEQAAAAGHDDNQKNLGGTFRGLGALGTDWYARVLGSPAEPKTTPPPPPPSSSKVNVAPIKNPNKQERDTGREKENAKREEERENEALARATYENAKSSIDIEMQQIEDKYKAEKLSQDEYFSLREAYIRRMSLIELTELNRRADAAKKASEKQELNTKIAETKAASESKLNALALERGKANENTKLESENRKRASEQLNIELARAEGRSLEARTAEIKNKYDQAYKEIEKRFAGTLNKMQQAAKDKDIDVIVRIKKQEIGKLEAEEIGKDVQEIINAQQAKSAAISRARDKNGGWDSMALDKAENASRDEGVSKLIPKRDALIAQKDSGVQGLDEQIDNINSKIDEMRVKIPTGFQEFSLNIKQTSREALESGLGDFFTDIAMGTESVGDAARKMARNFVSSLAQMAAQALAKMAIFALFNAITGGAAGAAGGAAGGLNTGGLKSAIGAGVKQYHSGGIASNGAAYRTVDPSAFLSAPRYHVGGIAGLAPGEVPAILQPGEEVLTRDNPRHVANGGGQQTTSGIKIINAIDGSAILDHVASSEGEKVVLNIISRNASSIRANLGD